MYEYGNWEQGRAVWFLGIHNSNLLSGVVVLHSKGTMVQIVYLVILLFITVSTVSFAVKTSFDRPKCNHLSVFSYYANRGKTTFEQT